MNELSSAILKTTGMKKSVFLLLFIFLGSALYSQPVNDVRITYAMNKTNPPSYTFKAEFNGEALKYFWYFSDNATYEEPSPTHVFEKTNKYMVKVKVQDKNSSIHYGVLEAEFEGKTVPSTSSVITGKGKVKDLSSVAGCGLVIILENGTTLIPVEVVPAFELKEGQFIELAYEILGNTTTICQSGKPARIHKIALIPVSTACKADFTYGNLTTTDQAGSKKIAFSNKSTGEIKECKWSFGDGTTSNELNPVHEYAAYGNYKVCLVIVTSPDCKSEYCISVNVTDPSSPVIFSGKGYVKDKSALAGCGFVIVMDNGTVLLPVEMAQNFVLKDGQRVEFAYALLQNTATTCQAGKPVRIYKIVEIPSTDNCKAYFTATNSLWSNMALMKKYVFSNLSKGDLKTCEWSFGDGTRSTEMKPIHEYAEFGEYKVCLSIETVTGCKSQYCTVLRVTDPAKQCGFDLIIKKKEQTGNTFLFYAISTAAIKTWEWSFGDGSISDSQNPQHTYEKPGTYEVTCTITTASGCTEKRSAKVQVTAPSLPVCPGAISLILFDPSGEKNSCDGKAVVKLLDEKGNPYNNVNYTWSNGMKGDTAWNLCPDKSYFVSAVIESVCQKNSSFAFLTTPFWQVESSERNCSFSVVAPGDDIIYKWSFGDGNIAYGPQVNYTYKDDGQYEVTLTAISESASSESSMKVAVIATGSKAVMIPETDLRIYPNPAHDFLNIQLNGEVRCPVVFEIIGMKGQTLFRKVHSSQATPLFQIYTGDLPGGIYLLRISGENRILHGFKFMIDR